MIDNETWDEVSRPNKREARDLALGVVDLDSTALGVRFVATPPRVIHSGLWLPGAGCQCLRRALAAGRIDPGQGQHILVERLPGVANRIDRWLDSVPWRHRPVLHRGPLHTLRLGRKIDFAFLDFLGGLDEETALWLQEELAPHLAPGADVAFTFSYCWRGSPFMRGCQSLFQGRQGPAAPCRDFCYRLSSRLQISDKNIMLYHCLLHSCFREHAFRIKRAVKYADVHPDPRGHQVGQAMLMLRYHDFQPRGDDSVWPRLCSLLVSTAAVPLPARGRKKSSEELRAIARRAVATRRRLAGARVGRLICR